MIVGVGDAVWTPLMVPGGVPRGGRERFGLKRRMALVKFIGLSSKNLFCDGAQGVKYLQIPVRIDFYCTKFCLVCPYGLVFFLKFLEACPDDPFVICFC